MNLDSNQLLRHLQQQGLAPVYLLMGDEPLQEMECADQIRAAARAAGYHERSLLGVENGRFDWKDLRAEAGNLSLFANRRLLELRLGNSLPPDNDSTKFKNSKVWHEYLASPAADTVLIVFAPKGDSKVRKSKWFQALGKVGVILQLSTPGATEMPAWIRQRLSARGLKADDGAVTLLAERAEGHLLAAAQEIEKLHLLYPEGYFSTEEVLNAVSDSARIEVFAWLETVLSGDAVRLTRNLRSLRACGVEIFVIATFLEREVRSLCQISHALQAGRPLNQVLQQLRIWGNRKTLIPQAVKRYSPSAWLQLLKRAGRIDHILKGMEIGNPWDEVLALALRVAGIKLGARTN